MRYNQIVVERSCSTIDEGIQGFHDYTTKKEPYARFIDRVTRILNELQSKKILVKGVSYPTLDVAVITTIVLEE